MNTEDSVDYFELLDRVTELEMELWDSVKVVRCKDCKRYISERNECTFHNLMLVYPEFYCGSGERRE